jgi:hypothetical protein
MKIAYHASLKGISIIELFVNAMIKTFKSLRKPSNSQERAMWNEDLD